MSELPPPLPVESEEAKKSVKRYEKMKSYIYLCNSGMVHMSCLINGFNSFMESDFEDAYSYFESQGMIYDVQKHPEDADICHRFMNFVLNNKDSSIENEMEEDIMWYVGQVMKSYRGIADPCMVANVCKMFVGGEK